MEENLLICKNLQNLKNDKNLLEELRNIDKIKIDSILTFCKLLDNYNSNNPNFINNL